MSEKRLSRQPLYFSAKISYLSIGVEISIIILKGHSMGVSVFCGEGGEPGLQFGGVF